MADVLVLGAGMVGTSTALAFQAQGHSVALVDRKAPGQETSYGNAGVIQAEAAEPYALPRDLGTLFKYAIGQSNDVTWNLPGALSMAPALWTYFRNSAPKRHAAISQIYAQLTARATDDHAPLIQAAGAQNLISQEGMALLFRDANSFDAAAKQAEAACQRYGVTFRALDGTAYQAEEPALRIAPAGAIHWQQSWNCSDPGGLTAAYASLFQRQGGDVLVGDAETLAQRRAGWCMQTESGEIGANTVVIALGPWSPKVLRRFGYRIPMIYKRGYHGHYQSPVGLRRPFLDVDNGIVATSMKQGLRLLTGAQLVPQNAPADSRQLDRGREGISDFLEIGPRIEEPQWFGTRPCLPDMLPMVGAVAGHAGLWVNFGHGHQGFTLGPTTARLLADAHARGTDFGLNGLAPSDRLR